MIKNSVAWPDGARCAVTFTWDMDADSILHLAHPNDADTRISTASMLRYGPLIAVERIPGVLDGLGVKHGFFVTGWCAEQYPQAVTMMIGEGHEAAHHDYLHEYPNGMTRDRPRAVAEHDAERIVRRFEQRADVDLEHADEAMQQGQ